jgi:hypothetical protein
VLSDAVIVKDFGYLSHVEEEMWLWRRCHFLYLLRHDPENSFSLNHFRSTLKERYTHKITKRTKSTMNANNNSCLYSSIILLNNVGCRLYSLGLSRDAVRTFKSAMTFVKSTCSGTCCSVCDVVNAITSSEMCYTSLISTTQSRKVIETEKWISTRNMLEVSFDCMDFSKTLNCLNTNVPNVPIHVLCDDIFYQPESVEIAAISAIILHNIGVGLLAIAMESDMMTSQLVQKSCISILHYAEKILVENARFGNDDDNRNRGGTQLNFHTPVIDVIHALIVSKIYSVVMYSGEEHVDIVVSYKRHMDDAIAKAHKSVSAVTSICSPLIARRGSPAA